MADKEVVEVGTPQGPGRLFIDSAAEPQCTLALGHGAGGGVNATDLELLARRLPPLGVTVVRFEQPWRTAGGRVAVPPPRLDVGWRTAMQFLVPALAGGPLFFGGRSAGARVACRTANDFDVAGVVCLAFPLHLPGQPQKSRLAELLTPRAPRLVLQGSNDSFGGADEVQESLGETPGVTLVVLPGADHSFRVAKASPFTPTDLRATLVARVAAFTLGHPLVPAPSDTRT